MESMFAEAVSFNQPIGDWNVGNVIDMSNMFAFAYEFNQDLSKWDVSNVTNMSYMFHFAKKFDQDVNTWDVSKKCSTYKLTWMNSHANNKESNAT
jgi:surface protein